MNLSHVYTAKWHTRFWRSIDESKKNYKQFKEKYKSPDGKWKDNCLTDINIIDKLVNELKKSIQRLNDKFNDLDFCNSAYNPSCHGIDNSGIAYD